jgi:hypothetical protein
MRKLIPVIFLLLASKGWGAVLVDATGTAVDQTGAATSATNSSLTVGAGSNRALVCVLEVNSAMTSAAITWHTTQNMVLISSYTDSNTQTVSLFGLVNPDSGNNSAVATWTGATEAFLQCQSYTGVSQFGGSTTFAPAVCTHATSAAPSITVNSRVGDETVSGIVSGFSFSISAVSATQLFLLHGVGSIEGGGSFSAGSAANTMTGTLGGSDVWGMCATNIASITPVIVQISSAVATAGSSVSASFANNVTAGNNVYTCVSVNTAGTVNTPTMTGESFAAVSGMSVNPGSNANLQCYKVANAAGGNKTVAEAGTGCSGCGWNMIIVEVNCNGACTDEATGHNNAACSTQCSVSTSGSATLGDLNMAFFASDQANETWTHGSGYIDIITAGNSNGNSQYGESSTATVTGTQTATASLNNSGDFGTDGIIAIQSPFTALAPTVTTQSPTVVKQTTATGNGTTTSNGGASITDEGVCVGTSPNPTTGCVSSGSTAVGTFTASLTGLTSGTQYWVNAYATNSIGTSYGNDGVSFGTLYASGVTTTGTGGKVTFTGTGGKVTIK